MAITSKIMIIGVGDDGAEGLTKQAADCIQAANVLVGSPSLLAKFPNFAGRKEIIGADLDRLANSLDLSDHPTVVLASGDPLFYGTVFLETSLSFLNRLSKFVKKALLIGGAFFYVWLTTIFF